jgi:hypothetical protein
MSNATNGLVVALQEMPIIFENISKEAAQGDAFAYYADLSPSGTCFKIADYIMAELGADKVQQLAIGIGGSFNHTGILFEGEVYIDGSMPLIIHDLANDVSYTTPGKTELEVNGLGFTITRSMAGIQKGVMTFQHGLSNNNREYERFKYQWVWGPCITNRIIVCKAINDGFLHEVVLDSYTIYDPNGIRVRSETIYTPGEMMTTLDLIGVDLRDNKMLAALQRLWNRQYGLHPRVKEVLLREFI